MKENRFIELVNLYIDRQISPAEHAELELEIQSNPARRQVYLEYCRMHRATKLVYESFRANAEGQPAPARQPASIAHIADRARRRRANWRFAAAGLAAAACVTLVFALRGPSASDGQVSLAAAQTQPAASALASADRAPRAVAPIAEPAPALGLAAVRHTLDESEYAMTVAALRAQQERLLNAQSQRPALSLFEDGVFEPTTGTGRVTPQSNPRRPNRAQTEFTAFQFQR
jgi:hypothetical protein